MPLILSLVLACSPDGAALSGDTGTDDCAASSIWYVDGDGDGFGAGEPAGVGCVRPDGHVANAEDCDDSDPAVNPFADESCNGIDDDCDGSVDPPGSLGEITCYADTDGDGFGDAAVVAESCDCTGAWTTDATDCDDSDPSAYPGAEEILYDGIDQDCLGLPGEYDRDGDGYDWEGGEGVAGQDCDDNDPEINPDAWDDCEDDIDQNCDDVLDECGLLELTTSDEAWAVVYRNTTKGLEPEPRIAFFGDGIVHAGDSDGDGNQEILAQVMYHDTGLELEYRLIEIDAGTTPGWIELDDATIANVKHPKTGGSFGGSTPRWHPGVVADFDFDADGTPDYLFDSVVGPPDGGPGHQARIDLVSGPIVGELELEEGGGVEYPLASGLAFNTSLELLTATGTDTDWAIAVRLFPSEAALVGTDHAGIIVFGPEHLDASTPIEQAPTLYTSGAREVASVIEAQDLDGDGIDDLVSHSHRHDTLGLPPGRVWVLQGPFDDDRILDDAELVIDGPEDNDEFAYMIFLTTDMDKDGYVEVGAVNQETDDTPATVYLFDLHVDTWPTGATINDARSTIVSSEVEENQVNYAPRMIGDIDADDVAELALPVWRDDGDLDGMAVRVLEPPSSGTLTLDATGALVSGDVDVDIDNTGFGVSILGGVDYDGDTHSDLVIGEYGWDQNPDTAHDPYGRFLVFRGEIGAD